jgi:hypothetical protein
MSRLAGELARRSKRRMQTAQVPHWLSEASVLVSHRKESVLISFNRATIVYLFIFALFCVGIWLILEIGSVRLVAAPNLNGQWQADESNPSTAQASDFEIDQSGKYLQLSFANPRRTLNLVLIATDSTTQPPRNLLQGQGWEISAVGPDRHHRYQFTFQPPPGIQTPHGTFTFHHPQDSVEAPAESGNTSGMGKKPSPSTQPINTADAIDSTHG